MCHIALAGFNPHSHYALHWVITTFTFIINLVFSRPQLHINTDWGQSVFPPMDVYIRPPDFKVWDVWICLVPYHIISELFVEQHWPPTYLQFWAFQRPDHMFIDTAHLIFWYSWVIKHNLITSSKTALDPSKQMDWHTNVSEYAQKCLNLFIHIKM